VPALARAQYAEQRAGAPSARSSACRMRSAVWGGRLPSSEFKPRFQPSTEEIATLGPE